MDDPYKTLGVARDASAEQIRAAYRGLAKACHPDLHPGDALAEARFKAVAAAYGAVSGARAPVRQGYGRIYGANTAYAPWGFWQIFAEDCRGVFFLMADTFIRGMS